MKLPAEVLRTLHRIHRQRADLSSRLAQGPKKVDIRAKALEAVQQQREMLKERWTKTRMASDERQMQLKSREDRVADLKAKLNACTNNKEYQTLREQIAADEQANSVLSDEILELLEKVDQLEAGLADSERSVAASERELTATRERVGSQREQLENELARVNDELGLIEAKLPADFRADYERMARSRGEDALAAVDGESCGGCNKMLSPQTFNSLYLNNVVFCSSCGSLLYLPEDRKPE